MSFIRQCLDFFLGDSSVPPQATPVIHPATNSGGNPTPAPQNPDSGHIQRKKFSVRDFRRGDVITHGEETWLQNGGVMEGEESVAKVVTASGAVIDPGKMKSICSVCGLAENELIRCDESHVAICHGCKVPFERPDGTKVFVSPAVVPKLKAEFDTWEKYDARQKGLRA